MSADGLTKKEKAANLLISLGKETAARIMKFFSEEEIKAITYEIVNNKTIEPEDRVNVLKEFYEVCLAQSYFTAGGVDYATALLSEVIGPQRSMELISELVNLSKAKPFDFMKEVDPNEVFSFIQYEADQTIAFILSYLRPKQSAEILGLLPPERQAAVAIKIAQMDKISPDIIDEIERVMQQKFMGSVGTMFTKTEGVDVLVEILNMADRGTEKQIFEMLEMDDAALADDVKKKMFVFENITSLGDREIQRFLSDVDTSELAVALKVATDELKNLILRNMSKRAADIVRQEMDLMGPVRLSEVEKAQQSLVNTIRQLDEQGEIIIRKTGEDQIVE